jgi:hypothetical protein
VSANVVAKALHAAFALHDQDPGRRDGMGDVLVAFLCYAHPAGGQPLDPLLALVAVVHVDRTCEDHEHFAAVVDVPVVGLTGPMHPDGYTINLGQVQRTPVIVSHEARGIDETHPNILAQAPP